MKKFLTLISLVLFIGQSYGQDIDITIANGNGGFEEDYSGWTTVPTPAEESEFVIDGTNHNLGLKALYYPGTDLAHSINAPINNLVKNETYALTFFSSGADATVYIKKNDGTELTNSVISNGNSGTNYKFYTVLFTASDASVMVHFEFQPNETGIDNQFPVYIDDVDVLPIVAGGNFGFEDNMTHWKTLKNWTNLPSDIVDTDTKPYEGSRSAHYPGGSYYQQLIANVNGLKIGKSYTMYFQAAGTMCDLHFGPLGNAYNGTYYFVNATNSPTGDYVKQSFSFSATATSMQLYFDLYPDSEGNPFNLYLDDFHVAQRAESGKLLINEVNSNLAPGASYIELFNSTDINLNISGLQLEVYRDNELTPSAVLNFPDQLLASNAYLTITKDNAAFLATHGFAADIEFPGLELTGIDGLIIREDIIGISDYFNQVPLLDIPGRLNTTSTPVDDYLYLRKGIDIDNGGSNLTEHWCAVGAGLVGTPGTTNSTTWKTTQTSAWDTPSNWSGGHAPCECDDAIVPAGVSQPVINNQNAKARNVKVESGASLLIEETGKLSVGSEISTNVAGQKLEVLTGSALTLESGASVNVAGLKLLPDTDFSISGSNSITKTDEPLSPWNESIERAYNNAVSLDIFSGEMTVYYAESELKGMSESSLVLQINNGDWTSYAGTVDETLNTISYNFTSPIDFMEVTVSGSIPTTVSNSGDQLVQLIYPNPTNDEINVSVKSDVEIEVYNLLGQMVLKPNSTTFNVSNLPSGTYFLKVTKTKDLKTETYSFIKL